MLYPVVLFALREALLTQYFTAIDIPTGISVCGVVGGRGVPHSCICKEEESCYECESEFVHGFSLSKNASNPPILVTLPAPKSTVFWKEPVSNVLLSIGLKATLLPISCPVPP